MLVEAANEVIEAGGSVRQMRFYGQEVNLTTAAIARMNLYLHDIEDARVVRGDTLRQPKFLDSKGRLERHDVVIANPPFSLKNWGRQRCLMPGPCHAVPPGGTQTSHGFSIGRPRTRATASRRWPLACSAVEPRRRSAMSHRGDQLEAVVGLAPNLYSTTISTLLIFRSSKSVDRRGAVLFVDGSAIHQSPLRTVCPRLMPRFRRRPGRRGSRGEAGQVRLVDHGDQDNGWDLNIGRYLQAARADALDVPTALQNLAAAQTALREAEQRLAERLKAAGYA
jgi:type I restriction enzyme M protein